MFQSIVVGTDGSPGAERAVDAAVELAGMGGATLHVVCAYKVLASSPLALGGDVPLMTAAAPEADAASRSLAEEVSTRVAHRAQAEGISTQTHLVAGDPGDALIRVAEDVGGDLIVVGNRGMSGARRFVLGSVPNKVSHHCPSSLLIIDTSGARTDTRK